MELADGGGFVLERLRACQSPIPTKRSVRRVLDALEVGCVLTVSLGLVALRDSERVLLTHYPLFFRVSVLERSDLFRRFFGIFLVY